MDVRYSLEGYATLPVADRCWIAGRTTGTEWRENPVDVRHSGAETPNQVKVNKAPQLSLPFLRGLETYSPTVSFPQPVANQPLLGNKGLPLEQIRRRLFMIDPTIVIGVDIGEGASEQLPNPRVGLRLR